MDEDKPKTSAQLLRELGELQEQYDGVAAELHRLHSMEAADLKRSTRRFLRISFAGRAIDPTGRRPSSVAYDDTEGAVVVVEALLSCTRRRMRWAVSGASNAMGRLLVSVRGQARTWRSSWRIAHR